MPRCSLYPCGWRGFILFYFFYRGEIPITSSLDVLLLRQFGYFRLIRIPFGLFENILRGIGCYNKLYIR